MMAPDLPEEPAPRNDFSSNMTLPARRRASCQAMLVPMTPPPTMIMSQFTAMIGQALFREQRRAQVALAKIGQNGDDELAGVFGTFGDLHGRVHGSPAADAA